MRVVPRAVESDVDPPAANGTWRSWLMTGARREPVDRRRLQGAHKELKRLLVEGMHLDGDRTKWQSFSDAMARQTVEEAVGSLPPRQKQLIKLAYFSDLSNREIAQGLGITLGSVERGLRQAIARVSAYVEHGRAAGRRAMYGLALFLSGRWLTDSAHQAAAGPTTVDLVRAGALAVAVATAGAILISQPASPVQLPGADAGVTPAISSAQPITVLQIQAVQIPHLTVMAVEKARSEAAKSVAAPVVTLPVITLPEVKLPKAVEPIVHIEHHEIHIELPLAPILHGLLGA